MSRCRGDVLRLIVIGASTGGPAALRQIFAGLTQGSQASVMVAQHMPENFTRHFAARLDRLSRMPVVEAEQGMRVQPGCAYVAPGGWHLCLHSDADALRCTLEPQNNSTRWVPSIDRLFTSAAAIMAQRLLAVVLTGMGSDGSIGVRAAYAQGGRVLSESAATATIYGMPQQAIATGCVHEVLPLHNLVTRICDFARGG